MFKLHIYCFLLFFLPPALCSAQKHDTLQPVRVLVKKELYSAVSPIPVQVLRKEDISRRNSLTVADAIKYFAGVNVKDYGGIGGLKTVSVRSLGANHTGIMYDGIAVGDAQGGQIDLGKFSVDNLQEIQLYNSGPTEILSTARSFASASLISLKTTAESFNTGNTFQAGVKYGSFGFITPSVLIKRQIGKKFLTAINGYYQFAKGDYPYSSYENDLTPKKRENTDIHSYKIEYDAAWLINDSNRLKLKLYYYDSRRGLPGAVILINNISNQRLEDKNFFLQSTWLNHISAKSSLLISGKFSSDIINYLDPLFPNNYGKLENNFKQRELYLSAAYKFKFSRDLAAAFSSDAFRNTLRRSDIFADGFANPDRNTFLNNWAVQLKKKNLEVIGNVLYTVINEKVTNGKAGRNLHEFSPSLSASVQPFTGVPLRIRGFYKNIFRAPTFNDLYYTLIGNTDLRPEYAQQYDIGITLNSGTSGFVKNFVFTVDGYLNKVKDKILAVPRQNLFQWSMQNVGKVHITGTDASLHVEFKDFKNVLFSSRFSYSFQNASNRSDVSSSLYKTQLPYTPKHSGSVNFNAEYKKTVLSYNVLMSSLRYRAGDLIPENAVRGRMISDITVAHRLNKKGTDYKITAEANNIFNTQYEIIKYYPMPRFNYRIGFTISINQPT